MIKMIEDHKMTVNQQLLCVEKLIVELREKWSETKADIKMTFISHSIKLLKELEEVAMKEHEVLIKERA